MDSAILWVLVALMIVIGIFLLRIPIIIAKKRNMPSGDVTIIAILSWAGLFFGITWVGALVWSILGTSLEEAAAPAASDALEAIRKLSELHDQGLITESEFAEKRRKLLERI
ncbi:MAG: SHOCT domain-containing protein [Duodenibacillus sp.]|nr:SHOCT domain-containing protein [Duodenibacillus sp.]HBC70137.1 hypothetical protein [Sutterella sp.]